jgi:hypothetical protein
LKTLKGKYQLEGLRIDRKLKFEMDMKGTG